MIVNFLFGFFITSLLLALNIGLWGAFILFSYVVIKSFKRYVKENFDDEEDY